MFPERHMGCRVAFTDEQNKAHARSFFCQLYAVMEGSV